jgi:hypothetical protein
MRVTKWEYCMVAFGQGEPRVVYYQPSGIEVHALARGDADADDSVVIARAIAQLGRDGWEMVGAQTVVVPAGVQVAGAAFDILFKRPLAE